MNYEKEPEETEEFLRNLDEGDRVHIVADAVIHQRGELLRGFTTRIDDEATIVSTDGYEVTLELDENEIEHGNRDDIVSSTFDLIGPEISTNWEYDSDSDSDESDLKPSDETVAMLKFINEIED